MKKILRSSLVLLAPFISATSATDTGNTANGSSGVNSATQSKSTIKEHINSYPRTYKNLAGSFVVGVTTAAFIVYDSAKTFTYWGALIGATLVPIVALAGLGLLLDINDNKKSISAPKSWKTALKSYGPFAMGSLVLSALQIALLAYDINSDDKWGAMKNAVIKLFYDTDSEKIVYKGFIAVIAIPLSYFGIAAGIAYLIGEKETTIEKIESPLLMSTTTDPNIEPK